MKRDIDRSRPWECAFLLGQRIEMSFVFSEPGLGNGCHGTATCLGCQTSGSHTPDTEVQCVACLMWFRRSTVVAEVDPSPLPNPWRWRSTFRQPSPDRRLRGPVQLGKRRIPPSGLEAEDDLRDFKRIRLVSEKKVMKRSRSASSKGATLYAFMLRPIVPAPQSL